VSGDNLLKGFGPDDAASRPIGQSPHTQGPMSEMHPPQLTNLAATWACRETKSREIEDDPFFLRKKTGFLYSVEIAQRHPQTG
jgi:hypothetical protein